MKISLTITQEPEKGRGLEFDKPDQFLVERVHFILKISPPACYTNDLQNTNGTRVDGKKVIEVELREGDIITIDETILEVAIENDGVGELKASDHRCRDCQRKIAKKGTDSRAVRDPLWGGCVFREPKKVDIKEIRNYRILKESGRGGMNTVYETWHKPAHRLEDSGKMVSTIAKDQKTKELSQRGIKPPNTLLATEGVAKLDVHTIADQKKREAKLATSGTDREKFVSDAAGLYLKASEQYERMRVGSSAEQSRLLQMNAHFTRGLSLSVRNITEEDASTAIALLDRAIKEMEDALEFADGADASRLEGEITNHRAKKCVREIGMHRNDTKKQDKLLDYAISYLGEAAESFDSLGDSGAYSSKTCEGNEHLYTALRLIRDGFRKQLNQKITDAVLEIKLAKQCYKSISNELGMDTADRTNEILNRVTDNLNLEGFDPSRAYRGTEDVSNPLHDIPEVGLRNMIEILVVDGAVNASDRKRQEKILVSLLASLRDFILSVITALSRLTL